MMTGTTANKGGGSMPAYRATTPVRYSLWVLPDIPRFPKSPRSPRGLA